MIVPKTSTLLGVVESRRIATSRVGVGIRYVQVALEGEHQEQDPEHHVDGVPDRVPARGGSFIGADPATEDGEREYAYRHKYETVANQ
jgi:hypothetical protein